MNPELAKRVRMCSQLIQQQEEIVSDQRTSNGEICKQKQCYKCPAVDGVPALSWL